MTKPIILNEGKFTKADAEDLKKKHHIFEIADIYDCQLSELFHAKYPAAPVKGKEFQQFKKERPAGITAGVWVYYPWSGVLLHTLGRKDLFYLRTNRNQLLITTDEQRKLDKTIVGIAGMSVGAGMAISLAYSGISNTIKISDFDGLETTNLNRLHESLNSIGKPKAALAAQRIYELNPFADVGVLDTGINTSNIDKFFKEPDLDIVIDEIDDFKMKVQLRLESKKHRLPLIMFTSLGDNVLIDVERYDLNPDLQIFHGLLGKLTEEIVNKSEITKADEKRYAVLLVGEQYIPTRALISLPEIGRTLVGRPQLYSTIAMDGGLAAYIVRKIVLENQPDSGRYFINFAELLGLSETNLTESSERTDTLKKLRG